MAPKDSLLGPQTSQVKLPDYSIDWYRTPLSPEVSKRLHETSDVKGFIQTGGFLACLLGTGALALYFSTTGLHALTVLFTLLYGLQANFLINGMHELGHGQVFKTRLLNDVFLRIISFLGVLHPDMFFSRCVCVLTLRVCFCLSPLLERGISPCLASPLSSFLGLRGAQAAA